MRSSLRRTGRTGRTGKAGGIYTFREEKKLERRESDQLLIVFYF